jgi:uncharacterized protein YkwD
LPKRIFFVLTVEVSRPPALINGVKFYWLPLLLPCLLTFANARPLHAQEGGGDRAQFERAVLREMNRVRTNPQSYAVWLVGFRASYQPDGLLTRPGSPLIRTREGVKALDEAIHALQNAAPSLALALSEPLSQAAREYAAEQSQTGKLGHTGRGSSTVGARMARQGVWRGAAGENIAYGSLTPAQIVYDMIVDDGQPQRNHRANILNPLFRVAGVGFNRHPVYRTVCVMEFAAAFERP